MRRLREAVVVAAMVLLLCGCGHQVTGLNQPNGGLVPAGQTLIRFETAGQPDYSNVLYLVVINTTGNGHTPYALGYNSNYADWSFAFLVGGGPGFANQPVVRQFYQDPSASNGVNYQNLPYSTGQVTFAALTPTASAANGFDIRFNRCILDFPPPNTTGQATPAPISHPIGQTCPPFNYLGSSSWTINIFTVEAVSSTVVDSLGNGPSDTSYPGFHIDTTLNFDQTYTKPLGNSEPQSTSAQISGIEVFSTQ